MILTTLFCTTLFLTTYSQPYNQPLDEFLAANDDYYSWNYTGKHETGLGWEAYLINMTSQKWLNETYVNKPIWWHWLWIVLPSNLIHNDFAVILGTGGDNRHYDIDHAPSRSDVFFIGCQNIARDVGIICGSLYQIPNEPLVFTQDPLQKSRSEDAIIAFGWKQFSTYQSDNNYRYNWLTHLPMTKATSKAMDTISTFAEQKLNINPIKRWGVSGASKRGWSAWLTAAGDQRIELMVPIVMDMPNFHPNLHHQYKAYGGWTFAFKDYYAENITGSLDDEWFQELLNAVDPYSFFERYKDRNMVTFVVDGTYDEFFMPDDEQFWWNNLAQPKYFLQNPDADHSQAAAVETDIPSLTTFVGAHINNVKLPVVNWDIDSNNGSITVYFDGLTDNIKDIVLWHGRSCGKSTSDSIQRRDFRMISLDNPCTCGIQSGEYCLNIQSLFTPEHVVETLFVNKTYGIYHVEPPKMPTGRWEAFEIGIKYQAFEKPDYIKDDKKNSVKDDNESWFIVEYGELVFTTQISIVPNTYPFDDCSGDGCYGTLL